MDIYFCAPREHFKDALSPIASELKNRGHEVIYTPNVPENAKVAIYNGHRTQMGDIEGEKRIVTFHGIDDAYKPKYFAKERWNQYDIGLLPGRKAAQVWKAQSWNPMARPKKGVYIAGWPKADRIFSKSFKHMVEARKKELGIIDDYVAIYAPTKENDGKVDACISAIDGVFDTLLIKHAPYDSVDYTDIPSTTTRGTDIITLDKSEDIMSVLAMGNILISDHSSVLLEGILVDTIPISVSDWPIRFSDTPKYPDETLPSFVRKTTSTELRSYLEEISENLESHKKLLKSKQDSYYANIGMSALAIAQIIEANNENPEAIDGVTSVTPRQNKRELLCHVPELFYYKIRYRITDRISSSRQRELRNSRLAKLVRFFDNLF